MKKTRMKLLAAASIFLLPFALFAKGQQGSKPTAPEEPVISGSELDSVVSGQLVEVTGTVRLVGNMPFPRTVVTDDAQRDWYIDEEEKRVFEGRDQHTVTIRARVELVEIILANNQVLGVRRVIREVVVLE
ncbi:MAG: hypothetical protein LBD13_02390 [Spirochaetaceae bacterium]|jgi:hypothetical protein|nr:hypothetical protein [Spirochaetaceae bacterium]